MSDDRMNAHICTDGKIGYDFPCHKCGTRDYEAEITSLRADVAAITAKFRKVESVDMRNMVMREELIASLTKERDSIRDEYDKALKLAEADIRGLTQELEHSRSHALPGSYGRMVGLENENTKLRDERDALREQVGMALGFAFTKACTLLDAGEDPRHYEIPGLLDEWNASVHPLPKSLAERAAEMRNQVWTDADIERLANDVGNAND